MKIIYNRADLESWEDSRLALYAARSATAKRIYPEEPAPYRTAYQRDRDRIIHSKAFRRLAHKTQVFIVTSGDHFRSRLTHTLEVSQIARTLARALALNEDLTEAVALAHDLGHTPFGHAGERILAQLNPDGFRHQVQSLRQVDVLARGGRGLNLTLDVRDGIVKHSKGQGPVFVTGQEAPQTLEGMLVRVSDIIAYLGHDLDDGLRAGLLQKEEIPKSIIDRFGLKASSRIRVMVTDLLEHTRAEAGSLSLSFSSELDKDMLALRSFLYSQVYRHPRLDEELNRGREVVESIYHAFMAEDELFLQLPGHDTASRSQVVCDFIAGMTDRYALELADRLTHNKQRRVGILVDDGPPLF